ncbi:MAG TPA: hypothetical protein VIY48_19740 [Candidatus Paceibacterota bacterium]
MKKILKFLKWSVIVLLGLPVVLYLVWVVGNLKKDELSPELTRLLAQQHSQMPEKDNAYFDTIGLAAPADMEPHAWGVSWFTQAAANDHAVLEDKPAVPVNLAGYPAMNRMPELPCTQRDAQRTCLQEVASDIPAVQKQLAEEAITLQRLDALLDKAYQEPRRELSFKSELPPLAATARASRLAQVRIAVAMIQHRDDAALARWKNETAFALRQARASHTLISTLVPVSALSRYQRLLAEYISANPKAARAHARDLQAMLAPFERHVISLQPALEGEAEYAARSFLSRQMSLGNDADEDAPVVKKITEVLATPLYDRRASANEFSARILEYARVAELKEDEYRAGVKKMAEQGDTLAAEAMSFHFHNPVGKLLLGIAGSFDYSGYLYKCDEIAANKALLAFAVDMIARNITSPGQIAQEISARKAQLTHPYSGELPVWDENRRTLSYAVPASVELHNYVPLAVRL